VINLPDLWPPQRRAIELVTDALVDGHRRICLASPTGSGKSRICWELCRDWLVANFGVAVYTNRKMLIEQLSRTAREFGLHFGVRSADALGPKEMPTTDPMQICSIQTEEARTLKKKVWQLHRASRVIIDEAHLNSGETMQEIVRRHVEAGASLVGLTATPLDIGHMYDHLIVAGTNSELRECGALVLAHHYGPDEPDCRKVKKQDWEYTENDIRKVMQVQKIFGRIVEWFNKLNPEHRPTICFAPGVPESLWLAQEFRKAGIEAAHIDGKSCFYKGEMYESDADVRAEILRASRDGECKILCNRFVLREGIDAPWLAHGILATIFGSLQSYLQSIGRLLRYHPSVERVTIQDHGGNWWRHGSANTDRRWELGDTETIVQGLRQEKLRAKSVNEPMCCPVCRKILMSSKCSCGFEIQKRTRPVIQEDGSLKEMGGNIFKPRFTKREPNTEDLWKQAYYRARNYRKGRTFQAARGLFFHEQGYFPPNDMPFMPKNERDWFRRVSDVPLENLT
jgi:superfamily II DNA or RNA helicase